MRARGIRVHGQNFSTVLDGEPTYVGFFSTFIVADLNEDLILDNVVQRLTERIVQESGFVPSLHSYFQVENLWDIDDSSQYGDVGGFSFYPMSFAQTVFARVKYIYLNMLVVFGAIRPIYRPINLRVGIK